MYNYKPRPLRDNAYLEFVRSLSCVVCGSPNTIAHHVIDCDLGGTTGGKASDLHTFPLCEKDHLGHDESLHTDVERWEKKHGSQLLHVARTQNQATAAFWGLKPPGGLR